MPLQQIFPRVYEFANGIVNEWFIQDDDGWTLFDTGYPNQTQKILDAFTAFGQNPSDIKRIVLTHTHPDHAGGLAEIKKITGAPAYMHPIDARVVRGQVPMTHSTPSPDILNKILYRIFIKKSPVIVPRAEIEYEINDGDVLPIGGGLRVIHAPGHSMGHCAFLLERDGGLLFAGDACSNVMGLAPSIVYDDHAEGRRSLQKLARINFDAACFGHGKVLRGSHAKKFSQKWR